MVSRTPRAADEVDTPAPKPIVYGTIKTPSEDQKRQARFMAGKNNHYCPPVAIDDAGIFDDPDVFGQAPWFDMDGVKYGTIIPSFSHEGFLPACIPLSVMETESWRRQYCY